MSNRLLRMPDVKAETGLSPATIYREIAAGRFPKQRRLTRRCVGWMEADVEAWKRARAAENQCQPPH